MPRSTSILGCGTRNSAPCRQRVARETTGRARAAARGGARAARATRRTTTSRPRGDRGSPG
eukprot:6175884-Pyramimonas_sp.AAC.1